MKKMLLQVLLYSAMINAGASENVFLYTKSVPGGHVAQVTGVLDQSEDSSGTRYVLSITTVVSDGREPQKESVIYLDEFSLPKEKIIKIMLLIRGNSLLIK